MNDKYSQDSSAIHGACASAAMLKWRILRACLSEITYFKKMRPHLPQRIDTIIGWGLKPSTEKARKLAARRNIPLITIEDGFLRSLGLGVDGYQPASLVVDHQGIYYDATRPSDLEDLIRDQSLSTETQQRANQALVRFREHRLSKYNHAPDIPPLTGSHPPVLLVDQTRGDASVTYGQANADTFRSMLETVLARHPEGEILVKVHPDVIQGKRRGYLAEHSLPARCRIIGTDINPWALFDSVDSVHVVTSQLGFEALMAGKHVVCHGLPFYAGWGLTEDHQTCPRRGLNRSLVEVFAAAYLQYARYANPYTGEPTSLEETIDLISDQKRQRDDHAGQWLAYGYSAWKKRFIADFLGPKAQVRHRQRFPQSANSNDAALGENILVWAQNVTPTLEQSAQRHHRPLWRMEDGFIRSVGLGADLTRPMSLVLDKQGIYYDPTKPSDLEVILNETTFPSHLLERARKVRTRLVERGLSKYNLGGSTAPALPDDRPVILVPGQVETDASVAQGGARIQTNQALLEKVRAQRPEAFVIYKPHPDVVSGARIGRLPSHKAAVHDFEADGQDIAALLERVHEVHTISSLTGFEALLRGLPVTTYGLPFYAGWGLTTDAASCPRRQRSLDLDELVAGTLILYPTYVDPFSRQLCNVETALSLLAQMRGTEHWHGKLARTLYRVYRRLFIGRF